MLLVAGLTQRFLLAWDLSVIVLIVWVLSRSGTDVPGDATQEPRRRESVRTMMPIQSPQGS